MDKKLTKNLLERKPKNFPKNITILGIFFVFFSFNEIFVIAAGLESCHRNSVINVNESKDDDKIRFGLIRYYSKFRKF